ncbi:response regulator transcription factor [Dechloromonas sp. XY25]|uniref:Response regulator transcription factor n=1 Tax=Dechloromonas hankyongensis TaxID=2908002 RepID=A0ABS9JZ98_9RHOO|nr:response regulator transcription factor [Dechloromonas hankyongensis]MCG2576228.1 response regulator transcription factor [Dechloromonas hankyongensis]
MTITVLIADDHAVVRDGLRLLLENQADIRVIGEVADGREAVDATLRLQPDVVLMDLAMPLLNGADATALIMEKRESSKIIILSMHSTVEHVFRALQAGALGYLRKESAGNEVVDAVRAVHAGRRYLSQKITESVVDDYVRKRAEESPLESLSQREREILQMLVEGRSGIDIARLLHVSPKTVDTYRSRMMQKLGIGDLPGLVKFALQHGLTTL